MLGEYEKRVLDNGLCVIGVENKALHSFACDVRIHAGPRFEPRHHVGLTHFLEHMLLQGCAAYPDSHQIMRAVEDLGGVLDASTHPESLELYLGVHRKHWAKGMRILTDVLLDPLFDAEEVEQEKRIVGQEIAEHRDEHQRNISAAELTYDLMLKEGMDELGTRGNVRVLQGFNEELVRTHYERFLIPGNMVVSLAGAFDFGEVYGFLADTLGAMPGCRPVPEVLPTEVIGRRARSFYRPTEKTPVVDVELGYHAYSFGHDRFGTMLAASHILGGALSSRLFDRVREERGLVYEIGSFPVGYSDAGSLDVSLSVDTATLVEAVEATLAEIDEFRVEGVTPEELERYKESVRCGMDILCDRPHRLADWLGGQEVLLRPDKLMMPEDFTARQEAISRDGLNEVIRDMFSAPNGNMAVVGPFSDGEQGRMAELFPAEEAKTDSEQWTGSAEL